MARVFLEYFIYLTDEALVKELQATRFRRAGGFGGFLHLYGEPGHPIMAPDDAAIEWSAPIQLGDASSPKVGPPNLGGDYFTHEYSNFPRDRALFTIDGGGFWGWIPWVGDRDYAWRGTFVYAGPPVGESAVPGATLAAMSTRRWIDGFELPYNGEGQPTTNVNGGPRLARGASRLPGGYGMHIDGPGSNSLREHTILVTGPTATPTLWERFYLRVHRFGADEVRVWKVNTSASQQGVEVCLLPGMLAIYTVTSAGTRSLRFTTPANSIVVHQWVKIDLIYLFSNAIDSNPGRATFRLYLNGALVADLGGDQLGAVNTGIRVAANVSTCTLGTSTADASVSLDLDDWIGANPPDVSLSAKDWNAGSHVVLIGAQGFAADHGAASWAGDWRLLRQRAEGTGATGLAQGLTSSVSGAVLSVATDAGLEVDLLPNGRGIAALLVGMLAKNATAALSGTLGYKLPGGADVLTAIQEATAKVWTAVYHLPAGLVEPLTPLLGLELKHVHAANTTLTTVQGLFALAEVIGVFGLEDAVGLTAVQLATPAAVAAGPTAGSAALVKAVKDGLVARGVSLTGPCGAFEITKRVAWALRSSGGGVLEKLTGNKCENRSVDIVAFPGVAQTRIFDMLIDGGGANTPTWSEGTPVAADRWKAPVDPGDAGDTTEGGPPLGDGTAAPIIVAPHTGQHNAPYPRTPWARGAGAFSPVVTKSGSYVGTGTFIDLPFSVPIHFLWIRPATAASGGPIVWFPGMNAAHNGGAQAFTPFLEVLMDPLFAGAAAPGQAEQRCVVRIAGTAAECNAVGQTYYFVAISDPGMRFLISDATQVLSGTTTYVNPLPVESFTPEALFIQPETYGATATRRLGYKGPGNAAAALTEFVSADLTPALTFGAGTLTLQSAMFTTGDANMAMVAFRRDDGSGDAGMSRVVQLGTYVGDGNASRTLALAPASGRRPMFAFILPHNAVAPIFRDTGHLTTTSTLWPNTANAGTGITGAGIDSLTIGSALNSNGIVYDVFVVPGDTAACNGGFSCPGEFYPVPPTTPPYWGPEPTDPETPGPEGPGDGGGDEPGGDETDFGTDCVAASQAIVNKALGRLGIGVRVDDIVNEQSEAAATARLFYSDDVSATLREYPWPFATRYAQLVWVAGTALVPANGDWTYAYRAPSNMMFGRRLVRRAGNQRRFDPSPIEWRLGSDATGALIYTNHAEPGLITPANLTVELEYTIRLTCAASAGDALFRSALAWRHAHSIAPILARDEKKAILCWQMYQAIVGTASTVGGQEEQKAPDGEADWIRGRD